SIPRAITFPPARFTLPSRRRRASSASIWSPTAPTSRTSARSAPRALHICRQWIFLRAATCWPTYPPFSARSTSSSGRWTDECPPSCTARHPAEGLRLQQGEPCVGEERDHEISRRPSAVCDLAAVVARAGAAWRLVAGGSDPACRRLPRHG